MRTPDHWQTVNATSTALLPFSFLYKLGFALEKKFTKKQRAPLPVISVGNITAGGAGKTPTCIALAQLLQQMGEVPHIITRGYGGQKLRAHRVDPTRDSAAKVGDEPLLLAKYAPTWVGAERIASARAAKEAGATILLADDALQHHALHHDLSILVVDLVSGFGNGRLIPAGPLRQTLDSAYEGPTIAVAIGNDDPRQLIPQLSVHGEVWRGALKPARELGKLATGSWLAFAGIAHPQKFYTTLREAGVNVVETKDFPDHHPYHRDQIDKLTMRATSLGARLVTTEKDAVRVPEEWKVELEKFPVALEFQELDSLKARLAQWRSGA